MGNSCVSNSTSPSGEASITIRILSFMRNHFCSDCLILAIQRETKTGILLGVKANLGFVLQNAP